MTLSVIIVHYRVPYFLELCLLSLEKALEGLEAEVLVVDNHSDDGTAALLAPRFPRVAWILNTGNAGFARANNQGLRQATGEYILFLNPDTILPEDFARRCLEFYRGGAMAAISGMSAGQARPGGLGVRMIDGGGRFLPESRRGFPTPWVAFCKMSGLTRLFPHSRRFGGYYLGWLPQDVAHAAPVLSGACLWVSREALDAVGAFDEDFFMYAEDIDLSYRLEKAGYRNYYFPGVTIVHFKGASTSKDKRYIRQFYKAMIQFRQKHFSGTGPAFVNGAMRLAIGLRAGMAAAGNRLRLSHRGARPGGLRGVWLTGDPAEAGTLKAKMGAAWTYSADQEHARDVLFCQGDSFPFKEMIAALEEWRRGQAGKTGQAAAFHAAGGHAVISSPGRDNRGEILPLEGD